MKPGVLEIHGTEIGGLLPANIVQAAAEDFKRLKRNAEPMNTDYEHFAFHRTHAHKASRAAGREERTLIELALKHQIVGAESGKKWTRLIYKDTAVLSAALELLGPETQENHPKDGL